MLVMFVVVYIRLKASTAFCGNLRYLDEWEHAALAAVNLLSLFQYLFGAFLGEERDAVFIGHDYSAGGSVMPARSVE